ncbi:MAG TPA: FeoB-associated Cys-rich membrane protein [Gaiellaceae bacterium]|nr:FeoB-associated Cys-rich membrane protein [Gaiellaceae bacterium]
MTIIVGVVGAALLFGLFTMLRPSDEGCTGHCAGCTRDGACDREGAKR